MKYFDRIYLLQYLKNNLDLKIYANREYLTIADASDLTDGKGIGYRNTGEPVNFDYRDIEQIKTGKFIYTIDQLNEKPAATDDAEAKKEPKQDTKQEKEIPTDDDKNKKESIHAFVINKDSTSPYFGTRGLVERVHGDYVFYRTWWDGNFTTVSCNKNKTLWE